MTAVFNFEITAHCPHTKGRCGCFHTPHGPVQTPRFMPVGTLATVKGISTEQLARTGAQMVLSNTYHLHLQSSQRLEAFTGLWGGMAPCSPTQVDSKCSAWGI